MSQAHNFKDITGQRFGRLTVLYRCPENSKDRKAQWVCKCDCGNIVIVTGKKSTDWQYKIMRMFTSR